jgi:hypothetical protein
VPFRLAISEEALDGLYGLPHEEYVRVRRELHEIAVAMSSAGSIDLRAGPRWILLEHHRISYVLDAARHELVVASVERSSEVRVA